MPKSIQYKKGSIVYFQGDRADKVFVLQNGTVDLNTKDIESGEDSHDIVKAGEFFGIKSTLGGYPREEFASVLTDATLMAFTLPEFEAFAKSNTRIVFKMLKVFSNQLREVNKRLSTIMQEQNPDPDNGLYNVAEFYLKQRKNKEAAYVLRKYIEAHPQGNNIDKAKAHYQRIAG